MKSKDKKERADRKLLNSFWEVVINPYRGITGEPKNDILKDSVLKIVEALEPRLREQFKDCIEEMVSYVICVFDIFPDSDFPYLYRLFETGFSSVALSRGVKTQEILNKILQAGKNIRPFSIKEKRK